MSRTTLTDRQKFYLELLIVILIFAFVFVFSAFFFDKIFVDRDTTYLTSTLSAFLGAFLAFIFVRIAAFFDKIFARKIKHRDSLVALETLCNEYQNLIGDDIFIIDDFVKIAEKNLKNKQPFIYFNVLHELHFDKKIVKGLGNLELINDHFSFEASVQKINGSISATNRFYKDIKDAFIGNKIDQATYFTNIEILISKLKELKIFLEDLEDQNKDLLTKVRILIQDELTFYTQVLSRLLKKELTDKQRNRIPKERAKLDKEIKEIQTTDRSRIDKLLGQSKGLK